MPKCWVVIIRIDIICRRLVVSVSTSDVFGHVHDIRMETRGWIIVCHVHVWETEVDITMKASIWTVETSVDHFRNKLACQSDDESVGDYWYSSKGLNNIKPDSNSLHFLSNGSPTLLSQEQKLFICIETTCSALTLFWHLDVAPEYCSKRRKKERGERHKQRWWWSHTERWLF